MSCLVCFRGLLTFSYTIKEQRKSCTHVLNDKLFDWNEMSHEYTEVVQRIHTDTSCLGWKDSIN